jgi:hypothetical protein
MVRDSKLRAVRQGQVERQLSGGRQAARDSKGQADRRRDIVRK